MQLGLVALAMVFLGSMGHSDSGLKLSKGRRQRRISTEGPPSCSNGCERCSEYNGCIKCKPKLFILLERNDIRQIGVCLASCPQGYFGMRTPDTNRCIQCKIENCEECFNRNFCTKCKEGLYSHRGRCYPSCPEGLSTTNGTMECVECELGEWSPWGPCMKKNKTCGFKKGTQTRMQELLHASSTDTVSASSPRPCAPQTERQKCTVQKTPCGKGDGNKNKGERRDQQRRRDKENVRGHGHEGKEGGKEGGKKGGKEGGKEGSREGAKREEKKEAERGAKREEKEEERVAREAAGGKRAKTRPPPRPALPLAL
ncbi:R-spondin-1-like [Oncorhynchus tshawytscha]|uniref:R-spondin Fu-CRD domain-containing protein n=1 Tax=Oncorhynchus tshawytscha TaxID=74940 RepID=A0AAZ3R3I9_ONCTS|nr:R-spondin-1-like [Oncorhynchus tshawytscha]XP_042160441.1 R-spondin-1-like [Oncorhynchus tshawytscha]